ncbi:T9SS type A sorting domain-containing protein, partial [Winogradskyella sp.]|uniref:T9SS type A sorting domain-containing protein n=1 Tax=Winogradskyella sp. TaxID=1883156 RepID=UPI003F6A22A1
DYEIVIDGVGQGSVQYFNDPDTSPGVNGTISVSVVDGTSTVGLILTGTLNGGSDIIEFDNFKVEGIYNGYAYSDGSWYPADPDGTTAASDAIVTDGTAVLSTNASLNQVIIKSGASLTINQGVTLTANTLDLESTSSSYASLINNGTITGTITYNRYTNTIGSGSTGGNDLIASPFSGQTFGAFATANDGVLSASGTLRAFAPFNTGSGNYENYDTSTDNATEIEAGTGYRAATDSGESLAFSGTLNSGDITVSLSDGASSYWNLIGNVYPSYLDLGDFLATNDNTIIQDAFYGIYGYDANVSDGSVFTIWDLNTDGDFLIAPGQGFFVAAPSGGGTSVTFTESMRRTGVADDFIVGRGHNNTGVTRAGINLNTASKSYVTNFYFRDINTLGLDPGYDTGAFDQGSDGLFSNLVADDIGIALVNQSLPLESLSNVSIPLVVNATAGEQLNFSLDSNTSLPANIEVYLEDILTGTSTLLNTSDYIFTPTSNLSGPGRFYVVFSDNALGVNEDSLNNVNIYALERELFIKGQLAHNTNATLFDMQGRAVLTVSLDTESQINTIDISGLSNGIYIVQLSDIEYSKSKKVILK